MAHHGIDAEDIEGENGVTKKEVNVFQVGPHLLVHGYIAPIVEVVFNLHVFVGKYLVPALVDDDFLVLYSRFGIAQKIECAFEKLCQHARLVAVLLNFLSRKRYLRFWLCAQL